MCKVGEHADTHTQTHTYTHTWTHTRTTNTHKHLDTHGSCHVIVRHSLLALCQVILCSCVCSWAVFVLVLAMTLFDGVFSKFRLLFVSVQVLDITTIVENYC